MESLPLEILTSIALKLDPYDLSLLRQTGKCYRFRLFGFTLTSHSFASAHLRRLLGISSETATAIRAQLNSQFVDSKGSNHLWNRPPPEDILDSENESGSENEPESVDPLPLHRTKKTDAETNTLASTTHESTESIGSSSSANHDMYLRRITRSKTTVKRKPTSISCDSSPPQPIPPNPHSPHASTTFSITTAINYPNQPISTLTNPNATQDASILLKRTTIKHNIHKRLKSSTPTPKPTPTKNNQSNKIQIIHPHTFKTLLSKLPPANLLPRIYIHALISTLGFLNTLKYILPMHSSHPFSSSSSFSDKSSSNREIGYSWSFDTSRLRSPNSILSHCTAAPTWLVTFLSSLLIHHLKPHSTAVSTSTSTVPEGTLEDSDGYYIFCWLCRHGVILDSNATRGVLLKDIERIQLPLHLSIIKGHTDVVLYLITQIRGMQSQEARTSRMKEPLLHYTSLLSATTAGHVNLLSTLLKSYPLEFKPNLGRNRAAMLRIAAAENHDKLVRVFVEEGGVDVDSEDGVAAYVHLILYAFMGVKFNF
jgi:hypothetical protein